MPTNRKWSLMTHKEIVKLPANTIKVKDPERYKSIIQLLKEGNSLNSIKRATGVGSDTLQKIVATEREQLGISDLANKLRRSNHAVLDRINEILNDDKKAGEVSFRDLSVLAGIGLDKEEKLASSQVPHTVNVTQVNVTEAASINDLIASLPTAKPAEPTIDAEVVDEEGFTGNATPTKDK